MEALIVLIVMMVPVSIVAIVAWMVVNIRRTRGTAREETLHARLDALLTQNEDLRERIETLETIVTTGASADWDRRLAQGQRSTLPSHEPEARAQEAQEAQAAQAKAYSSS